MESTTGVQTIAQKLQLLQPKPIDPSKCDPNKSLYWQIIRNNQTVVKRQAKQFNLGSTLRFNDPIKAAMFLLQREYSDSSLFKNDVHEAVFIPPTFVSNQYMKKLPVAILEYEVKKDINRLLDNLKEHSPDYWLTKELKSFLQAKNGEDDEDDDDNDNDNDYIDKKAFDPWVVNLKIMFLVIEELKSNKMNLPSTMSEIGVFVQACINEIPSKSPEPALKTFLRESVLKKNFKKLLKKKIEENPPQESNLRWIFGLELSELGEQLEHWFYDQLLPLKDDILQDTIVLSSVNFLTNVRRKMHKEIDFLIISWKKQLIISIEMKRELTNDRVFQQLESNHQLFEERLGDQLKPGWTFFPVVCVQNSSISIASSHFIIMGTEIKLWLTSILDNYPIVQIARNSTPLDQVQKLLKIIVFSIHASKKDLVAPITSSNWVEYIAEAIENVSTSNNIIFYSNQQMAALNSNDSRYNTLMIRGPFGVGKSTLLRNKAIQLNQQPEYKGKIMYLQENGLLYFRMKFELDAENEDTTKIKLKKFSNDNFEQILEQIRQDDIKAIFCDEFDMSLKDRIWKMHDLVDILWIVPSTLGLRFRDDEEWEDEFTFLDLSQNFRNSKEIVKMTKSHAEDTEYDYKEGIVMPPENFPAGCTPIFVDSLEEAMDEVRKRTKGGILVIIEDEVENYRVSEQITEPWKAYHPLQNDFQEDNPYLFLQEGNVLVIGEKACLGFEWPTVIVVEGENQDDPSFHSCNFMLRCTTNLLIVKKSIESSFVETGDESESEYEAHL
ncbi:uncharacterized protein [Clytia hemisphaerica]|uniref:AAA+ ATPase domain-containing protein n=1 Tax=Clytia hemisphaerica TaxID=252671 RepID=A0A7M5X9M6_9CNID